LEPKALPCAPSGFEGKSQEPEVNFRGLSLKSCGYGNEYCLEGG